MATHAPKIDVNPYSIYTYVKISLISGKAHIQDDSPLVDGIVGTAYRIVDGDLFPGLEADEVILELRKHFTSYGEYIA